MPSDCCFPRDAGGYRLALGKKMKVQGGKKPGKKASEHAGIGQASAPTRTKNGLNDSSINAHFKKKGFYSAYTPSLLSIPKEYQKQFQEAIPGFYP